MGDDELLERIRKAAYFARRLDTEDDPQVEAAILGVGRILAGNLSQFNRVIAPFAPSNEMLEATRQMGHQIVELTAQRGELHIKIGQLQRKLADAESAIANLKSSLRRRNAADVPNVVLPPQRGISNSHRMIMELLRNEPLTMAQLQDRSGLLRGTLSGRITELVKNELVQRYGPPSYEARLMELTQKARVLLDSDHAATSQPEKGNGHGVEH